MQPPPNDDVQAKASALRACALVVLWPAFVMASLLEVLVFWVVDPASLHGPGGATLSWSSTAVYSVAFLAFWVLIALSAAITLWLGRAGPSPSA